MCYSSSIANRVKGISSLVTILAGACLLNIHAAEFYWDADPALDGNQNGSGEWSSTALPLHWTPAAATTGSVNGAWVNAVDSIARVGAATGYTNAGEGGILTLGETITLNQLIMGSQAGAYTIAPGTGGYALNFGGTAPVIRNDSAEALTIQSGIQAAGGLIKQGEGRLVLSAASGESSGTGIFAIQEGTVQLATANTLPTGMSVVLGAQTMAGHLEVDQDQSVAGLAFQSRAAAAVNTVTIAEGATLTISGSLVTGIIDGTSNGDTTQASIAGDGSLVVNGGKIIVSSGARPSGSSTDTSILDMSGLNSFTANVVSFEIGRPTNAAGTYQGTGRSQGTVYLAENNSITTTSLVIGARAGTGTANNFLYLGQNNEINVDTIVLANGRFNGTLQFAAGLVDPTLTLRGTAGGDSRVALIAVGDSRNTTQFASSGGSSTPLGTINLTGGTVDLRIDTIHIGIGGTNSGGDNPNFGRGQGSFSFDGAESKVDINILNIGLSPNVSNSHPDDVDPYLSSVGNFEMGGGELTVNTQFAIARSEDGSTGRQQITQGTFTITGGSMLVGKTGAPVNIVMGDHTTTGTGMSTAVLNLNGGSASIVGNIVRGAGPTEGTVNLNGTDLNMNGGIIGTTALPMTLNLLSGSLSNVSEINGGGAVTKTGTGTLVLAGTNTFTGATTVSAGRLVVTSASALQSSSMVTVGSAGTFDFLPGDGGSYTFAATSGIALDLQSGATLGMELGSTTGSLILNPGASVNTESGALININLYSLTGQPIPSSSLLINSPTGGLTDNGATYSLGAVYNATNFTVSLTASDNQLIATTTNVAGLTAAYWMGGFAADNDAWAASNGSTQSNWVTNNDGTGTTALVPGATTDVFFSASGATLPATTTLGADMNIKSLTVTTASPLTLESTDNSLTIHGDAAITVAADAGAVNLNAPITLLGSAPVISVGNTGGLTLAGELSGSNGLTKTGIGTLTLGAAANPFSGRISILGGTLAISSEAALGVTQSSLVANYLTLNGGTLRALASLTLADTKRGITLASSGGTFEVDSGMTLKIDSIITGGAPLNKTGMGTLELTAANTYSGITTIYGGTLALTGANNRLPATARISFADRRDDPEGDSTLDLGGNSQTLASLQFTTDKPALTPTVPSTIPFDVYITNGSLTVNNSSSAMNFTTRSQVQPLTVDMSGLTSYTHNGGTQQFSVGMTGGSHTANGTTVVATVTLAQTNNITGGTLYLGEDTGSSGGGFSRLYLGQTNTLNFNTINLGKDRSSALLTFADDLLNPTVIIRGNDGTSAVSEWTMGRLNNFNATPWYTTADFSNGTLDALVTTLEVGSVINRFGNLTAQFIMGTGTLTVTNLNIGYAEGTRSDTPGQRVANSTFTLAGPGTVNVTNLTLARNISVTGTSAANGTLLITDGTVNVGEGGISMASSTNAGHTASGTLDLQGGTLSVEGDIFKPAAGAGTATATVILNGATLDMNGNNIGSAARPLDVITLQKGTLQNVAEINGGAAITKSGSADDILRLAGTNTYTGTTTVSGGSLLVNGTHSGGGAYTVQSGATLGGSGSITPASGAGITIAAGATLSVGDGTLTGQTLQLALAPSGQLSFTDNTSVLTLDLLSDPGSGGTDHSGNPATADLLTVTGTINLNGARLVIADPNGLAASFSNDDTWKIFDWSGITNDGLGEDTNVFTIDPLLDLPALSGGRFWDLSDLYIGGTISVIPEPSRAMLIALGIFGCVLRRRRK